MNLALTVARNPSASTWNVRQLAIMLAVQERDWDFNDLWRHLGRPNKGRVSMLVTSLSVDGYVKRKPFKGDRRKVMITSTSKGNALMKSLLQTAQRRAS